MAVIKKPICCMTVLEAETIQTGINLAFENHTSVAGLFLRTGMPSCEHRDLLCASTAVKSEHKHVRKYSSKEAYEQ